jgi:malonate-semialdehyde dehydrogenase (acetylating) / methylmalonate-semialdehyde dehydrogenase
MRRIGHWIGGTTVDPPDGRSGPVYDPATGEVQAEVAFADTAVVDSAVQAAKDAFPAWRATPLAKRSEILFRFRELVERRREEVASILTSEQGKVRRDANAEIMRSLESIEYACGIPSMLKGEFSEQVATGVDVYTIRQPLGVIAGITPFNFPALVPLLMFPHAVACGNTFVLKPSEKDPSASMLLAEIVEEAGLPTGVLNVANGDAVTVDALASHPDVKALSFIGSTPVARHVYEIAAVHGKRVQALGGGKNHMIVMPDADIDAAADAAVSAAYGSTGERCMAISVVLAVGGVGDALVDAIRARLDKVRIGPGTDPEAEMGPLITGAHREKVASYVDSARDKGAVIVADGRDHDLFEGPGFFIGVTLIDHATTDMPCYRDEIFGPVLAVIRIETFDEALEMINDNPFGNGASIITRDGHIARRFQFETNIRMIGLNVPIAAPMSYYSIGGWKDSLFGDTHIQGPDSLRFYTKTKVVTTRWVEPGGSKVDLGFPQNR